MNRHQHRLMNKQGSNSQKPPTNGPDAFFPAAIEHEKQGRFDDAIHCYQQALALHPNVAEAHNNLGNLLARRGQPEQAIACYRRALALKPDYAQAHNNLGNVLMSQNKLDDAATHFQKALALLPDTPEISHNLGIVFEKQNRFDDAARFFERAIALKPSYSTAHLNLGNIWMHEGNSERALACYKQALVIDPGYAEAHNNLANLYVAQNQLVEAETHFSKALALAPDLASVHYNRAALKTFKRGDPDFAALEALAGRISDFPDSKKIYVHFALAKALDDVGEYARAFDHWLKGNALKRQASTYHEAANTELFQHIAQVFDATLFERLQNAGEPSQSPIFIIGMPRSGTTLIEQILASHPQVHGPGELDNLSAVVRKSGLYPAYVPALDVTELHHLGQTYLKSLPKLPDGKHRMTDKMPTNFFYTGLIHLMFPNAKIIHVMREPMDTCFSNFSKLFLYGHEFSYELGELGRFYMMYARLMDHWRAVLPRGAMLDVSYEALVDDLEGQSRRIIDYCGLSWDENVLRFYETKRSVHTASNVQVRQKLFRSSLQRWKPYEVYLKPLQDALAGN